MNSPLVTPFMPVPPGALGNAAGALRAWADAPSTSGFGDLCLHFLLNYTSPHTLRAYWLDLCHFQEFCHQKGLACQDVTGLTPDHVALWRRYLLDQNLSSKTIERKLATLSALLRVARELGRMDKNPIAPLPKARGEVAQPTQALTASEVGSYLQHWQNQVDRALSKGVATRAYATARLRQTVVAVLLGTGMRVGEVLGLLCGNHRGHELIFQSKGGRTRKLVLDNATQKALMDYRAQFRLRALDHEPLFVRVQETGHPPRPLTQQAVDHFLRQGARQAGLEKNVSAHSMRATYATLLHQQGVGIVDIQERLGHSNVNTTGLYTKRSTDQEKAPARRIDILGRMSR